uniref:Uncharacterized protein n=1 Tax=Lactuca sativa TaxID=4236 RepID=A0A9R1VNC5_LACSA|nr:hypothetical protein LSAT_V11C400169700 [Lactuca sativa]
MTPTEIKEVIEKLVIVSKNSVNEDGWNPYQPRGVKEVINAHLESQISELTKVALLLTKEKIVVKKPCGICLKTGHPANMCPILQNDVAPVKPKQQYQMPPGFHQLRNYQQSGFQQNFQQQNYQQPGSSNMALEDIVKTFQTETRASIKNLKHQVSQLATFVGRVESQGKLPGHTKNNPKNNVSVISLKSGNLWRPKHI